MKQGSLSSVVRLAIGSGIGITIVRFFSSESWHATLDDWFFFMAGGLAMLWIDGCKPVNDARREEI